MRGYPSPSDFHSKECVYYYSKYLESFKCRGEKNIDILRALGYDLCLTPFNPFRKEEPFVCEGD
ncbi:hypothetical protein HG1285_14534 [Hydrogenivirga sp. 128-5-R1-1]|nr:hypothetical protein HG1285_14534 [Hydrogenivirga sp. 128-5-R1-1]